MNLSRAVALDYAQDHIHCNALCPGCRFNILLTTVRIEFSDFLAADAITAMTKHYFENEKTSASMKAKTPWWNNGNIAEVAKGAVFLASDDADWVTGIALPIDGGFSAQ